MTPEEARVVPASRDTDVLVGRLVLGWYAVENKFIRGVGCPGAMEPVGFRPSYAKSEVVPWYSVSVQVAWEIVEHLRGQGINFECRDLFNGEWAAIFSDFRDFEICIAGGVGYAHRLHDINNPWEWPAKADTFPLAICRAALQWSCRPPLTPETPP